MHVGGDATNVVYGRMGLKRKHGLYMTIPPNTPDPVAINKHNEGYPSGF